MSFVCISLFSPFRFVPVLVNYLNSQCELSVLWIPSTYHQHFVLLLPEGMMGRVDVGTAMGMIWSSEGSTVCTICFYNSSVSLSIWLMFAILKLKEWYSVVLAVLSVSSVHILHRSFLQNSDLKKGNKKLANKPTWAGSWTKWQMNKRWICTCIKGKYYEQK